MVISRTASRPSPSIGASASRELPARPAARSAAIRSETAQIGSVFGLVLAPEAHQLADVGQPAGAAWERQHRQVISGLHERTVHQRVDAAAAGLGPAHRESRRRRRQRVTIGGRQTLDRARASRSTAHTSPPRSRAVPARMTSASDRGPDQRRGEHRVQRLLVAGVGEHPQIGDEVEHLGM